MAMLLKGMDPTVMSVFYDLVNLEIKMIYEKFDEMKTA